MADIGVDEISTYLKWCSGGGEIGYHVKIGGHHFAESEQLQGIGSQQLNLVKVFQLNDGTDVCLNIVTKEDSNNGTVLKLNTLIKMHMSNGNTVLQNNYTGVQLNHASAVDLRSVTMVQLMNGTTVQLENNSVVKLNDGTVVQQKNHTTGQLNWMTVHWYNCIEHWCNHAAGQWCNNRPDELVGGPTMLWYTGRMVQGANATMVQ